MSLIILFCAYLFSLCATFFVNSTALLVRYSNNLYDEGEEFVDLNNNKIRDEGESFKDKPRNYYPLFREFFSHVSFINYLK